MRLLPIALLLLAADLAAQSTIDLMTRDGAAAVNATWRYSDVRVVEVPSTDAAGRAVVTNDFEPHAEARDFNDAAWEVIDPPALAAPRSNGRLSFNWYRVRVTIPETIDGQPTAGTAVYFEAVVDDYAEVWIDGQLPLALGQKGGSVVAGFNAPNRLLLTASAVPGQQFQIAVFGINGPISATPANFIFFRSAKLDFTAGPRRRATR
jgi:gluconolactonase